MDFESMAIGRSICVYREDFRRRGFLDLNNDQSIERPGFEGLAVRDQREERR